MERDQFVERVQSLPPELYNMIYEDVFTAEPGRRRIAAKYKPPKLLSIDRTSRELYAKTYYGDPNAAFIHRIAVCVDDNGLYYDDGRETLDDGEENLVLWLRALPKEHRALIREIRIMIEIPKTKSGRVNYQLKPLLKQNGLSEIRKDWLEGLKMERVRIKSRVLRFQSCVIYVND